MHKSHTPYPIDHHGIRKIGVNQWRHAFYMPLTGTDFQKIYENIMAYYLEIFCHAHRPPEIYWASVSHIRMVHIYSHYIFHILRFAKLREQGYQTILTKQEMDIHEAREELQIRHPILNLERNISLLDIATQWLKNKRVLSQMENTPSDSGELGFSVGSRSREIDFYCELHNLQPSRFFTEAFTPFYTKKNDLLEQPIQEFINAISNLYPEITQKELDKIHGEMRQTLTFAINFLKRNLAVIEKTKAQYALSSRLGHPFNRAISAAWQMAEKKIVGFPHGHTYATCYDQIHIDSDGLSVVSELFASSKGQANLLKALAKDRNRGLKMATPTYPAKSYYPQLFDQLQKQPVPTSIKRVMLVGFPISNIFYPSFPSYNDFTNIHLELNLIHVLKKNGFEVLYKAHPDKLDAMQGLFDTADTILTAPFESVFQQADCILFSYSRTSTFGYAMLTTKPIVLIDLDNVMWHPAPYQLIQKRCNIIKAQTDANGTVQFDSQEVLDAINTASQNLDYEIVHQYAF